MGAILIFTCIIIGVVCLLSGVAGPLLQLLGIVGMMIVSVFKFLIMGCKKIYLKAAGTFRKP